MYKSHFSLVIFDLIILYFIFKAWIAIIFWLLLYSVILYYDHILKAGCIMTLQYDSDDQSKARLFPYNPTLMGQQVAMYGINSVSHTPIQHIIYNSGLDSTRQTRCQTVLLCKWQPHPPQSGCQQSTCNLWSDHLHPSLSSNSYPICIIGFSHLTSVTLEWSLLVVWHRFRQW